jgi:hypothetical protein
MHTEAPAELQALGPQLGMTDDRVVRAATDEVETPRTRGIRLTRGLFNCATVLLFLAAIATPMLARWTGMAPPPSAASEQRRLAPLPSLTRSAKGVAAFPAAFDEYVNDNFGYRNELMRGYALTKVFGLHDSCASSVVVGRDGWLFLDGRINEATDPIADARHVRPLSPEQVEVVATRFITRRDWLAALGIGYVVIIPPNKETVYADKLPPGFEALAGPSPLDQVSARLKGTGIEFIDLRNDYAEARRQGKDVYYKTDTHWNWLGAAMAYTRLMKAVQRQTPGVDPALLEPTPLEAFERQAVSTRGYGLAKMLGLADVMGEDSVRYDLRAMRAELTSLDPLNKHSVSRLADPRRPRAVMLHDSFSIPLMPYISEHFSSVDYQWTMHFEQESIARQTPAVVIEETGERGLRVFAGQMQPPSGVQDVQADPNVAATFNVASPAPQPQPQPQPQQAEAKPQKAQQQVPAVSKTPSKAVAPPPPPTASNVDPVALDALRRRFEASHHVCLAWKPGDAPPNFTKQLTDLLPQKDGSLKMTATGGDPQFFLPTPFVPTPVQPAPWVARVDIRTTNANVLQLFWRTESQPYSAERMALRPLVAGRNVIYVELKDPGMHGFIRLDPGTRTGEYTIYSVEIRSCPRK